MPQERTVLKADAVSSSTGSFADVSFELRAGEILGIAGLEGSGKEDLADALAGGSALSSGTLTVEGRSLRSGSVGRAQNAGLGYVPPDRKHQALFENLLVSEGITMAALGRYTKFGLIRKRAARTSARELADQVRVHGEIDGPPSGLSGGNQQKTVLARILCREASVLVLAEPTAGVDVGAKAEIYRILAGLASDGVAILMVSSEMSELLGCCHRIMVMREGEVSAEFDAQQATEEAILVAQLPVSTSNGGNDSGATETAEAVDTAEAAEAAETER